MDECYFLSVLVLGLFCSITMQMLYNFMCRTQSVIYIFCFGVAQFFWFHLDCLRVFWTWTGFTGHWRLFVSVSSHIFFGCFWLRVPD